jgi:hypothetical protein
MNRPWLPCDDLALEVLWRAGTHRDEIAELLHRTPEAVRTRVYRLEIGALLQVDLARRSLAVIGRRQKERAA